MSTVHNLVMPTVSKTVVAKSFRRVQDWAAIYEKGTGLMEVLPERRVEGPHYHHRSESTNLSDLGNIISSLFLL
jgi:hypothetical protein